ncbi:XRE family transcriptional regulator [Flaviflexus salsibiostraticola]|uniref:XRE family transcriptional regulator n=2 Tax=Flaviflexus salsibiostraticola TaxID=1282737 RepID=A0A3Q8WSM7_9ACTO|nr:XRE family transcriptional regulator [Flaviflexus salsibiostraticola]
MGSPFVRRAAGSAREAGVKAELTNSYRCSPTLIGSTLEGMATGPAASAAWAEFAQELGHNLRRAREAKRLTQEDMAEFAGISLYAYQQYERGKVKPDGAATNPRLATVLTLCEVLETPIEKLLPEVPKLAVRTASN